MKSESPGSGIILRRGCHPSRNSHGGNATSADGNKVVSSQFLAEDLKDPESLGRHPHSPGFADQRVCQQDLARATLGTELSGSNYKKGGPGRIVTADRGSVGERGFILPSKLKQVYVAKPAITSRNLGSAAADSISNIFSGQEVA